MTSPVLRRWFGVAAVLGVVCALTTLAVVRFHSIAGCGVDQWVLTWMVDHRDPALTAFAIAVTNIGSPAAVAVLTVLSSAAVWWISSSVRPAVVIAATVAGAGAASTVLKLAVAAQRPPRSVQLLAETDHAFPSGHVTGTLALLGIVAAIAGRRTGAAVRAVLACFVAGVVLLIAVTRLYLGVHWLTDVLGGALLGGLAVVLGWLLLRRSEPAVPHPRLPPGHDRQRTGAEVS